MNINDDKINIADLIKKPKQRAILYFNLIYILFEKIPNYLENPAVKEIHAMMMMLPEYWDSEKNSDD